TIVVMNEGKIQQIGSPTDIYNEPKNAFVADFIGESNIIDGVMVEDDVVKMYGKLFPCVDGGFAPNEPVDVVIRPEDIDITKDITADMIAGTVASVLFMGVHYEIRVVGENGFEWLIHSVDYYDVGERVGFSLEPNDIHVMEVSQYDKMRIDDVAEAAK
ncbi:MAG: TOBE domain-containing protein, partial [Christensenella sp.]